MTNVTLIGLGPMGQAMARAWCAQGYAVTVWNRTASRAADVVAAGATLAKTPAEALAASKLVVFLTTLSSLLHATALVGSAGVSARQFIPEALGSLRLVDAILASGETGEQIDRGIHPGTLSTTRMMGATADHIVDSSRDAQIDLELPRAVQSHYARAIAAGHGNDDWTSLIEIVRAR